jgi:hypothetical protein
MQSSPTGWLGFKRWPEDGFFVVAWRWLDLVCCAAKDLPIKRTWKRAKMHRESILWSILHLKNLARFGGFIFPHFGVGRVGI